MRAKLLISIFLPVIGLVSSGAAASFTIAPTAGATSWAVSGSSSGVIPIESQYGGPSGNYTFVFSFLKPLTSVSHATITSGLGSVTSSMIDSSDPTKYIVNLTGVTNAQFLTITLSGVSGIGTSSIVSASVGILVGDTTGNGLVNSSDIAQTQSQSGLAVTSLNFREDVNGNGVINSSDIALVQSMSGTGFPSFSTNRPEGVPDSGSSVILFALSALTIFLAKTTCLARNSGGSIV